MALCDWCKREMLLVDGCSGNVLVEYPDGEARRSIPSQPGRDGVLKCHDCGVMPGRAHHPGCDSEVCPRCRGQLVACGCLEADAGEKDPAELAAALRRMN